MSHVATRYARGVLSSSNDQEKKVHTQAASQSCLLATISGPELGQQEPKKDNKEPRRASLRREVFLSEGTFALFCGVKNKNLGKQA